MNKNMLNQILKDRKRKTRSLALILCLSMVVSLGTFAGFHKTAQAKVYTKEVLDCPYTYEGAEPVAHVHNDDCYEGETLVCTLPEREAHTHTDECFAEQRVLVCGLEENPGHQHSEECYDDEGRMICQIPEGEGAHTHTDECYSTERVMICDKQELPVHVHDAGCIRTEEISVDEPEETVAPEQAVNTIPEMPVSDPNADLETVEDWNREFDNFELSGNWAEDLILVAATQQGHGESQNNFDAVLNDAGDAWVQNGYTRYGAWYGVPYTEEWSAMFVSFCLRYAGIPEENVPNNPTAAFMAESFSKGGLFAGRDYVPAVGDLIFFDTVVDDEITNIDHMGIVYYVDEENGTINTVEGDRSDIVATFGYHLDDEEIVGYGILPKNPDLVPAEDENEEPESIIVVTTEEEENEAKIENEDTGDTVEETAPAVPMPAQSWERTAGGIKVVVEAPEGAFPENTQIAVTPVNGNSLKDTVSDAVNGEILEVQAVDITFFNEEGQVIEPATAIRVSMTPAETQNAEEKANVVHIDLEQQTAEVITQAEGTETDNSEVVFDAEAFTIYAIVYTVHFEYEVDGETYTSASMPGAEYTSLAEVIRGLGIVSEEEIDTFVSKISTVASTNEEVAMVENTDAGLCVRVLRDGDAQIVITMQDGAQFRVDVVADGETATGNETATVSTVGDLYLPTNAKVEAKVLPEEQSESAIAAVEAQEGTAGSTAAAETAYQVFDISLENVRPDQYDGFRVEVTLPENVVGKDFHMFHIHDGVVDELELKTAGYALSGGIEQISRVSFITNSFSKFVLQYTVDFEYEVNGVVSYYSIEGGSTISLVDLLSYLGINISTDYIESVTVSNDRLISVSFEGGQWMLTSLKPFTSEETLTVLLVDGSTITIKIKDDAPVDLTNTITNVKVMIDGQEVPDGSPVVQGRLYDLIISFQETDEIQFTNDNTPMYYHLPAGVEIPVTEGTFEMDFGEYLGVLKDNKFWVDENEVLYVQWNTSDPRLLEILQAADSAHFNIHLQTEFDQKTEVIEWNQSVETHLDVIELHDLSVSKTGRYDSSDDKIHYTVTVNSEGSATGIKVTDTITGTALTSDVNTVSDITVTRHRNGTTETVTPTDFTKTDNGFVLNLPDMQDGDTYVVEYTASVDYTKLGKNGKTTYLEANNGVKVEWEEGPGPKEDNSYEYEINYSSLNKTVKDISGVVQEGGKSYRTITWEIEANKERKVPVIEIKDSIRANSREHMTMDGTGLTITVTKENGTTETRNLLWGDDNANGALTKTDDWSWTYVPPENDGKASYKITYQTKAEVTGSAYPVNNDVTDDHGTTGGGASVGPDGQDTIVKTVTSVSEQETEWSIDITVPKRGTTKTTVTDIIPRNDQGGFFDTYKSCAVTGLISDQESYDVEFKYRHYYTDQWGNYKYDNYTAKEPRNDGDVVEEVYITFYHLNEQGEKVEGLIRNGEERNIHVTVITENNQEWLEAAKDNYWSYYQHKNTAKFGDISATAEAAPALKEIEKHYINYGTVPTVYLNDGEYPYYKYEVVLKGVTDGRLQIFDTFDTEVFEVLNLDELDETRYKDHNAFLPSSYMGHGRVDDGINATTYPYRDSHTATFTPTSTGVMISTEDLDKTDTGAMYPCYRISYILVLKNPELAAQKALEAGGKTTFTNRVDWDGAKSEVDIEYGNPIIDKECVEIAGHKAKFTIKINPDKLKLGATDGEGHYPSTLTLTDTFSPSLSIDYSTIQIVTDPTDAPRVTYDYSGRTGTFVVPNETAVTITYTCNITQVGTVQIFNKAILDGKYEDYTESYEVVSAEGTGGAEIMFLRLKKYASSHLEEDPLPGAVFRLLDSEKNPVKYTNRVQYEDSLPLIGKEITFTTDSEILNLMLSQAKHGVTFKKNTVYYLEEIVAPPGMQLDPTLYSFVISDDLTHANYTREDGIYVYYVGDILKIRNTPETQQLQITKRFGGNVELTPEQKNKISFKVEKVDENGNTVSFSAAKVDENGKVVLDEHGNVIIDTYSAITIPYSWMTYDKYSITGLDAGDYRVTEFHEPLGLDNVVCTTTYSVRKGGGTTETQWDTGVAENLPAVVNNVPVDENITTNIIFTNEYSTGAYYFTKLDAGTEQPVAGAEFTVYDTTDPSKPKTVYTTGLDGKFMIKGEKPDHTLYDEGHLYYVEETKAADGYVIPDPAPKYYFYFGTTVPAGAEEHDAINLSSADSESTHQTVLNTPETSIMVKKEWKNAGGTPLSEEEIRNKTIDVTLKRKTSKLDAVTVTVNVMLDDKLSETKVYNDVSIGSAFQVTFSDGWGTMIYNEKIYALNQGPATIDLGSFYEDTTITVYKDQQYYNAIEHMSADYSHATSYSVPVPDEGYADSKRLSFQNDWYYLWNDLPTVSESGDQYYYYVEESTGFEGFTITYSNNEGIQTGTITVTNTKKEDEKGALKLKKLVTVNGTATTGILANGDYTFTVTGPGTSTTVNKTVTIKVENGVATKYKIDDATTYTDLPEDKFVKISDLTPGDYTITETDSGSLTLTDITGGKSGTADVRNKKITVTVTAGETVAAEATATFTNNLETTEIEGTKTWVTARVHSDPVLILRRVPSDTTPALEPETVMAADGETPLQPSWTENRYKYENLPKYNEDGKKYTYTVAETGFTITEDNATYVYTVDAKGNVTATPEGAPTFVYSVDQSGFNFTNTEQKEFEFAKVWTTNGTSVYQPWPDNVESITVTLTRTGGNGAPTGGSVKFTVTKDAITPSTSDNYSDFAFKAAMIPVADHVYTYKITGLDALWKDGEVNGEWTYSITETPVPGYNSPKYFTVKNETWVDSHGETGADGVRIVNDKGGVELPETGGIGTTLFTALGGLMTITAGAILTIQSYRRRSQNA